MATVREKRILCGNFVSTIVQRLGLANKADNKNNLGNPVFVELIGELDFAKSKLLTVERTRLLRDDEEYAPAGRQKRQRVQEGDDDEAEDAGDDEDVPDQTEPQPQPQSGIYDFSSFRGDLQGITRELVRLSDRQGTLVDHLSALRDSYGQLSRHQAYLIERQQYLGSMQDRTNYTMDYYRPVWDQQLHDYYDARPEHPMPTYQPPNPYIPREFQSDYQYPQYTPYGGPSGVPPQHHPSFYAGGSSDAGVVGEATGAADFADAQRVQQQQPSYGMPHYDPYGSTLFGETSSLNPPSIFDPPPRD